MRPDTSALRTDPIYLRALMLCSFVLAILIGGTMLASANSTFWKLSWPDTDFSKKSVEFDEIMSGGPPKDGIPSIDKPSFVPQAKYKDGAETEPVMTFVHKGDARAYPLRVLMWHEIVNDMVGGLPVSVTYCPLCNSSIVFDRRIDGKVFDFGTTGKLRKSDIVMYDRQTESWWQQFTGTGIVGDMTGKELKMLPARVESLAKFRARYPAGRFWSRTIRVSGPMAAIRIRAMTVLPGRSCTGAKCPRGSRRLPMWSKWVHRPGRWIS